MNAKTNQQITENKIKEWQKKKKRNERTKGFLNYSLKQYHFSKNKLNFFKIVVFIILIIQSFSQIRYKFQSLFDCHPFF